MRLTLKETREREEQVKKWIDEGLGVVDMSRLLNIRSEAVRRFIKLRGWETDSMKEWRESQEKENPK